MHEEQAAECTACRAPMDAAVASPCPNCGATGTKLVYATISVTANVTPTVDIAKIRHSFAFNRLAIVALIVITLVSPLISFLMPGLPGAHRQLCSGDRRFCSRVVRHHACA
jgi:hypothetical protein